MRINKFVAFASGLSRRAADTAIEQGRVTVNGQVATLGTALEDSDIVTLDGVALTKPATTTTILLNKPAGYVVSRNGQGSQTIYDLLPSELHDLKPVGRLDKDSSGLLLLTNDGQLANELTHPSHHKIKLYHVTLNDNLQPLHRQIIAERGMQLSDGVSRLGLDRLIDGDDTGWLVTMHEGRNRQIRRTFEALGYSVTRLHRVQFGTYTLESLEPGTYITV
jgi:23S rRNA pseudouridine2605 synthase